MKEEIMQKITTKSNAIKLLCQQIIENLENYQDENVESLQNLEKWFVDGAGENGAISKICIGMTKEGIPGIKYHVKVFENLYTNNEMEYLAMIMGLLKIKKGGLIFSDSKLVVEQLNGNFQCKADNLILFNYIAKSLVVEKQVTIKWVRREANLAGIHLDDLKKGEK